MEKPDARFEIILTDNLRELAEILADLHHDNAANICGVDAEVRLRRLYRDNLEKLTAIIEERAKEKELEQFPWRANCWEALHEAANASTADLKLEREK